MIPIGFFIGTVSRKISKAIREQEWLVFMCYIAFFPTIIIWIRGYFRDNIRGFVWNVILIFVLSRILQSRKNIEDEMDEQRSATG